MIWLAIGSAVVLSVPAFVALFLVWLYFHLVTHYLHYLVRLFTDRPLFISPRGVPTAHGEEIWFHTAGGRRLRGCYVAGRGPRRGVILFGLEFGSNCWACVSYCRSLLDQGFDIFSFEPRGQGESDAQPGYEPMQWVTRYEVEDFRAAIAYLRGRSDADPKGIGFFGISKGGSAGLIAAAPEPYVRCFVTDGIFGTYTTMVPYMMRWVDIVSTRYWLHRLLPPWFYGLVARKGLAVISETHNCEFVDLEPVMRRLAPRPLLMIHGELDNYIKPDMARALFARARQPKEFWLVEGAKHNQALQVQEEEYRSRVLHFFQMHLASGWRSRAQDTEDRPVLRSQARATYDRAEVSEPVVPSR